MKRTFTLTVTIKDPESYATRSLSEAELAITATGESAKDVYQTLDPAVMNLPALEEMMHALFGAARRKDGACATVEELVGSVE